MLFPTHLLRPTVGSIRDDGDNIMIEVPLESFELPLEDETGPVSTSIRMEGVMLPSAIAADIESRSFNFPSNPDAGYIDASVYLGHRHHPVDVTLLRFGAAVGDRIPIEIETVLCFEYEGLNDYENTPYTTTAMLIFERVAA